MKIDYSKFKQEAKEMAKEMQLGALSHELGVDRWDAPKAFNSEQTKLWQIGWDEAQAYEEYCEMQRE